MLKAGFTYDLRSDYRALGLPEEDTAEFDSESTIAAIEAALRKQGCDVVRIGHVRALTGRLARGERWDFVFNFAEGLYGMAREAQVPALLEAHDIPYTFSDPLTMALSLDKPLTKRIVESIGVPTPAFAVVDNPEDAARITLPYPLFAKPIAEGSGKGIGARSRCENREQLLAECKRLRARFAQPVLVEPYLPGREFTVGILGTGDSAQILGAIEVLPRQNAEAHAYGYENKEFFESRIDYAPVNDAQAIEAARIALMAHRALRCRDASRVDLRCDARGAPQFLEINPISGLNPERSDLVFVARFAGLSYDDLIGRIVASCLERTPVLRSLKRAKTA